MDTSNLKIKFNKVSDNKLTLLTSNIPRIYISDGYAEITSNDKSTPLSTAIIEGLVDAEDLADIAQSDSELGRCQKLFVKDGGSLFYIYPNFNLIKFNNADGVKDLIIGPKELDLNLLSVSRDGIRLTP